MNLSVATWNVNSVRLRFPLIRKFLVKHAPDVLCLQETKCPDELFPRKDFARLGYEHIALHGQKGWHGVAVVAKRPFADVTRESYCGKNDARHVAVRFDRKAGIARPVVIHNYYIPAGGDEPDPRINEKFAHKLAFLDELKSCAATAESVGGGRAILVGDLNVAPLEHDVWSHKQLLKVVSHTPVEVEKLTAFQQAGGWIDVMRGFIPASEKLYTWWSYRAQDWAASDRGRRLDHVWASPALKKAAQKLTVVRDARGWERPSDHVPVMVGFEV